MLISRCLTRCFFVALLGFLAVLPLSSADAASEAPDVVVSIKPLHSLVAGVMGDRGEPKLLLRGAASPHSYSLRPSDARALSKADLVFWVGPSFETFLVKPLRTVASGADLVALADAPGVEKHPYGLKDTKATAGAAGHDESHAEDHDESHDEGKGETHDHDRDEAHGEDNGSDHGHDHGADLSGSFDPHLWLDPVNAQAMLAAIAAALAAADPDHAEDYRANAALMQADLAALTEDLESTLAPSKTIPFLVFHDAYGYFVERFGLTAVGAIALNPERPPGAARVAEIHRRVADLGVVCVFSEPQFPPKLITVVMEGTDARSGVLDPLGTALPAGPEAYGQLLRDLAASLRSCLLTES